MRASESSAQGVASISGDCGTVSIRVGKGKSIAYLQLSSGFLEIVDTASNDGHIGALLYKNPGRLKSQALRAAGHVAVLQVH